MAKKSFALLGDIEFEIEDAPRALEYKESSLYSQHDVIEGKSTLQYAGESLQTLTLNFRFHASWCNPDAQLARLQGARRRREPLPLVLGSGVFRGNYLLEDITVGLQWADSFGKVIDMLCQAKLIETLQTPALQPVANSPFKKRGG